MILYRRQLTKLGGEMQSTQLTEVSKQLNESDHRDSGGANIYFLTGDSAEKQNKKGYMGAFIANICKSQTILFLLWEQGGGGSVPCRT